MNRGLFIESEHKALPPDLKPIHALEIVPGDLLMSRASGSRDLVGSVAVVPKCRPRLLLCDKVFRLHTRAGGGGRRFLAFALNSSLARWQIEVALSGGSGLANNIPQEVVKNLVVAVGPPEEQAAIVAFLDRETLRIDALVAKKERLIDLLEEQRAALITRAVTKGLDPAVPMKDSGVEWLGHVPVHWQLKRVRELADSLQTGPFGSQLHSDEYVSGGWPVINPADIRLGSLIPDRDCTVDDATGDRLGRHRLRAGDIVFARRGELGRCGVVRSDQAGWICGTGSLRLRLSNQAGSDFLVHVLSTDGVREWLELESVGATMQNVNTSIIGRIPLAIPPVEEQARIERFVHKTAERLDSLVAKVQEAKTHLEDLRIS